MSEPLNSKTDEIIKRVREELQISEGWIAVSYEERRLIKYAIDSRERIEELEAKLAKAKEGLENAQHFINHEEVLESIDNLLEELQ